MTQTEKVILLLSLLDSDTLKEEDRQYIARMMEENSVFYADLNPFKVYLFNLIRTSVTKGEIQTRLACDAERLNCIAITSKNRLYEKV